jgi:hypothetical protein
MSGPMNRPEENKPSPHSENPLPNVDAGGASLINSALLCSMVQSQLEATLTAVTQKGDRTAEMRSQLRIMCRDPAPEFDGFRDTLVRSLANQVQLLKLPDDYSEGSQADNIFQLTSELLDCLMDNSNNSPPASLNILCRAAIHFIDELEDLRLDVAAFDDQLEPCMEDWINNHRLALQVLHDTLLIPGFLIEAETSEACLAALERVLGDSKGESRSDADGRSGQLHVSDCGPTREVFADMVDIWMQALKICQTIGNFRLHEPVEKIARGLFHWTYEYSDTPDVMLDLDHLSRDLQRNEALALCFDEAVLALEKCQDGQGALELWHLILKSEPIQNPRWQAALRGLAAADAWASAPYLGRVLNVIGNPDQKHYRITAMLEWLELYLEVPATGEVLMSSGDKCSPVGLKVARHSTVVDLVTQRLEAHDNAMDLIQTALVATTDPVERAALFELEVSRSPDIVASRAYRIMRKFVED